ncbi:MAG: organoarsenical effux MFS transporter ArsJ [Cyanobacteriota bacterium]|nr:organoarsenical effux MFS transporter ArsJ [Cyanobacteriota bacterium]
MSSTTANEQVDLKSYALVTAAYWGFTLTDGALRMLVLLYFHQLGYSALEVAILFVLYEIAGVATNLIGGWIGSRFGLKITLFSGLGLQIFALIMLALLPATWPQWAAVIYVMVSQALSGTAKDLTKMSSKSAIKLVVPPNAEGTLFKWVAILTGSKNALKGVGFFLGGALLSWVGFTAGLWIMVGGLALVLGLSSIFLKRDMGKTKQKVPFKELLSKTPAINVLSGARFFLFGARDVWFVVGLPLFLESELGWSFTAIGTFFAAWVIGYGVIQGAAPSLFKREGKPVAHGGTSQLWVFILAVVTAIIAVSIAFNWQVPFVIVIGLGIFGAIFAVNSSVHSFLILAYTDSDRVALNVGFYYMANAGGRLLGTVASGLLYQWFGLAACLWGSVICLVFAWAISFKLPRTAEGDLVQAQG